MSADQTAASPEKSGLELAKPTDADRAPAAASHRTLEPRSSRLALAGVLVVGAAAAIVVTGLASRADSEEKVTRRTLEQAPLTVQTVKPQRLSQQSELVLPGEIQAYTSAPIYARASGYVTSWKKDIGDLVRHGETLADIDTPELDQQYAAAKADVANAQANAAIAQKTATRYRKLVGQSIVSEASNDEKTADEAAKLAKLEATKADLERLQSLVSFKSLTAPFDGVITARSVDVGALITAGETSGKALYQVADIHEVRIYVHVPQAFVAGLAVGSEAKLRLPQFPKRVFEARITGVSNAISSDTRTALVQLRAENADHALWPGAYAEVHFQIPPRPDALSLPATALIFGERGVRIAVLDASGKVAMRPVEIGRDIGANVEVLSGLEPSDKVVDAPPETLDAGQNVQIAPDRPDPQARG